MELAMNVQTHLYISSKVLNTWNAKFIAELTAGTRHHLFHFAPVDGTMYKCTNSAMSLFFYVGVK